jgi:hypothetical protein
MMVYLMVEKKVELLVDYLVVEKADEMAVW